MNLDHGKDHYDQLVCTSQTDRVSMPLRKRDDFLASDFRNSGKTNQHVIDLIRLYKLQEFQLRLTDKGATSFLRWRLGMEAPTVEYINALKFLLAIEGGKSLKRLEAEWQIGDEPPEEKLKNVFTSTRQVSGDHLRDVKLGETTFYGIIRVTKIFVADQIRCTNPSCYLEPPIFSIVRS